MQKFLFIPLLLTAMLAAGGLQAADEAALLQRLEDRLAIEALMWRYVRALDTLDADAYVEVFTEDGRFGSGNNATQGREALHNMVTGLRDGRAAREAAGEPPSPPMYHVIANSWIEFTGPQSARFHSYWMTVFGARGQETPPRVAAAGRGIDELVKIDGQWLIQSRDVAPQD